MLSPARIVEVITLEGFAPVGKHRDEFSAGDMPGHEIERQISKAEAGEAGLAHLHDAGEDQPAFLRDDDEGVQVTQISCPTFCSSWHPD